VPRVDFYVTEDSGTEARARLACRIIEKAYAAEQRVVVRCTAESLARIDELLWTFGDGSFVPHEPLPSGDAAIEAPVALTTAPLPAGDWQVLVNLSHDLPADWSHYERVAEVLDGDADTRSRARTRFRAYRDGGSVPQTHNVSTATR
jgi:DNA polymerase III subunit chi